MVIVVQKRLIYSILEGQRYSCQRCGWCCGGWAIQLDSAERDKLLAQVWVRDSPRLQGVQLFREEKGEEGPTFYITQVNGRCAFLEEDNLCLIQKRFGEEAKPAICRGFPLVIGQTVEGVLVGANYACPSLIRSEGEPFCRLESTLLELLERADDEPTSIPAVRHDLITPEPALNRRTRLTWQAYLELERSLLRLMGLEQYPLNNRVIAVGARLREASRQWPYGGKVQIDKMMEWLERVGENNCPGALDRAVRPRRSLTPARKSRMASKIAQAESLSAGRPGDDQEVLARVAAIIEGKGRLYLSTLEATVDLAEVERLFRVQDDGIGVAEAQPVPLVTRSNAILRRAQVPALHSEARRPAVGGSSPIKAGYQTRLVMNFLLRKSLLESSTLLKGYEDLMLKLHLARWYAAASAAIAGRLSVDDTDVVRGIQVSEKIQDISPGGG